MKIALFNKLALACSVLILTSCNSDEVDTPNLPPVANAGIDKAVTEQQEVTLTGAATDSDGSVTSYSWSQSSGMNVTLSNANSQDASFTAPETKENLELEFQLTATDDDGGSHSDTIKVTITPVNEAPMASAGDDLSIDEKLEVSLTGSASDSDGTITSYQWSQTTGSAITLSDNNIENPTFVAPVTKQTQSFEFQLTVTDDEGATAVDSVLITVNPVNELELTIEGKVFTANPLASAVISTDLSGSNFQATTNTAGEYQLVIAADEDLANQMVNLVATGSQAQSFVKLLSSTSELQSLINLAGDDLILNADEFIGVNINQLTTAITALAQNANNNELPSNSTQLSAFTAQKHIILSDINVEQLAAMISLSIDESASEPRLAIPATSSDTFDFALKIDEHDAYRSQLLTTPELTTKLLAALQALKTNSELEGSFMQAPAIYSGHLNNGASIEDEAILADNIFIDFKTDGTGSFALHQDKQDISWSNTGSLELTLGAKVKSFQVFMSVNGNWQSVERQSVYDSITMTKLASIGNVDFVKVSIDWHYHYPNAEFADQANDSIVTNSFLYNSFQAITNEDLIGTRSLPMFANFTQSNNESPSIRAGAFNFAADNTVIYQKPSDTGILFLPNDTGTWNLNETGVLSISIDTIGLVVHKLADNYYSTQVHSPDGLEGYFSGNSYLKAESLSWTTENTVGVYQEESPLIDEFGYNAVQLYVDGTGRNIEGYDDNENGVLELNEYQTSVTSWSLNDGKLIITDSDNANVRTFELFKIDGDRYHYLEHYQATPPSSAEEKVQSLYFIKSDTSPLD